ncbi:hypothetical protein BOX15_Mlig031707g2, partial [Macrostomum lignano]
FLSLFCISMDCFKSAMRSAPVPDSGTMTGTSNDNKRQSKSHKQQSQSAAKHSSSERHQAQQLDMPYDPIDLGIEEANKSELPDQDLFLEDENHEEQQQQRDWWETLFPARFGLDSDPLQMAEIEAHSDAQSLRVDPMTPPGRHGNAYRRVWERMQRDEAAAAAAVAAAAAAAAAASTRRSSPHSSTEADDVGARSRQSRRERQHLSSRDKDEGDSDCLWTAEELRLFRGELAKLKKENHVLKAAVRFQAERLSCLDTKCRSQSRQLEAKSGAAGESAKACERYRILAQGLQARTDDAERRCAELRADLALAIEERDRAREEARDANQRLQQAGAKLARFRQRESNLRDELARDFALREEQIRAEQADQLRQLEDSLADLRAELRKERYLHSATRLGHQQLLSHFSSSTGGSHGNAVCSACGVSATSGDTDIRLF